VVGRFDGRNAQSPAAEVVDGALAARFARTLAELVEHADGL
jgi:pyruvate/2-oxoglutarate dehydrogenase complex dihydrolipoamide acyltransferase (E2) component